MTDDVHPEGRTDDVAPEGRTDDVAPEGRTDDATALPPVVDYAATWHRLRRTLAILGLLVVVAWLARAAVAGELVWQHLGELVGLGLFVAFAIEVVVVGGSALRGLIAAGERGDRLSRPDVSLLPPQVGRSREPR